MQCEENQADEGTNMMMISHPRTCGRSRRFHECGIDHTLLYVATFLLRFPNSPEYSFKGSEHGSDSKQ